MEPGSTHQSPIEFPETWLGLWKDSTGRVIFLRRLGARQVQVSVAQGVKLPFFPVEDGGFSVEMAGLYFYEPGIGPILQVQMGHGEDCPVVLLRFNAAQGNRLRFAEPWDLVYLITLMPTISRGEDCLDWFCPIGPYHKANEEEDIFLLANPKLA